MKTYKYQDLSVAIDESKDLYLIEKDSSFYKLDKTSFFSLIDKSNLKDEKIIRDNSVYLIIMISVIVFTLIFYFSQYNYVLIDKNFGYSLLFLVFNIFIHELGHILALKFFNPTSKVSAGFKFIFIYPAFYVNTSSSYMIPKFKRISIYLAGNFMNCIFVLTVMLFFPNKISYCYLIITNILINFIPIIKSDGYYAFITAFNKYNNDKGKLSTYKEDFIRGFIMFIFLNLISLINNILI